MNLNKNHNPLVSVIIPTFNSENFIRQAILSVLNQTYKNFEIIIVDDGSKDQTVSIINSFTQKDERIKIIQTGPSGRPSVPRNKGIEKATGEYIAFLDSDDLWTETKISRQLKVFETKPEIAFTYSMSITFGEVNIFSPNYELLPLPFRAVKNYDGLLNIGNTIPLSSVLIKGDVLKKEGGFDEDPELKIEDYDLWLRLGKNYKFHFLPRVQVFYRVHKNQFSADSETRKKWLNYLAEKRNIKLPVYNYFGNKNIIISVFRNLLHFEAYSIYTLVGWIEEKIFKQ